MGGLAACGVLAQRAANRQHINGDGMTALLIGFEWMLHIAAESDSNSIIQRFAAINKAQEVQCVIVQDLKKIDVPLRRIVGPM